MNRLPREELGARDRGEVELDTGDPQALAAAVSDGQPGTSLPMELRGVQGIVDSVSDYAIFLLDREGRVLTWNRGARVIKGYSDCEIIGRSFAEFYLPEERTARKPERLLRAAAEEGRVEDDGWRVRKEVPMSSCAACHRKRKYCW